MWYVVMMDMQIEFVQSVNTVVVYAHLSQGAMSLRQAGQDTTLLGPPCAPALLQQPPVPGSAAGSLHATTRRALVVLHALHVHAGRRAAVPPAISASQSCPCWFLPGCRGGAPWGYQGLSRAGFLRVRFCTMLMRLLLQYTNRPDGMCMVSGTMATPDRGTPSS